MTKKCESINPKNILKYLFTFLPLGMRNNFENMDEKVQFVHAVCPVEATISRLHCCGNGASFLIFSGFCSMMHLEHIKLNSKLAIKKTQNVLFFCFIFKYICPIIKPLLILIKCSINLGNQIIMKKLYILNS